MTETISRKKNLANKKSRIPDKCGKFSSMIHTQQICINIAMNYFDLSSSPMLHNEFMEILQNQNLEDKLDLILFHVYF